ncbi:hypothetical protein F4778DRAFT_787331 [Xylariomycetidae sp. FL2044]|nr:hypothetical protein F4778DRAFT_787331 [Xylariomycetidae sp. FL2044]
MEALSIILRHDVPEYKESTQYAIRWIATTSQAYGYPEPLDSAAGAGMSEKKKKKYKMLLEKTSQERILTCKQLIHRTSFLSTLKPGAQGKPPFEVPTSVIASLDRAVKGRTKVGDRLQSVSPEWCDSDFTHGRFVETLQTVAATLKPLLKGGEKDLAYAIPSDKSDGDPLANRFDSLEVQEPSAEFQTAHPPRVIVNPKRSDDVEIALKTETGDVLFQEFADAIMEVAQLLTLATEHFDALMAARDKYASGTIDLAAASLTTNFAIDTVRQAEQRSGALLQRHGGSEKLLCQYLLLVFISRNQSIENEDGKSFRRLFFQLQDTCRSMEMAFTGNVFISEDEWQKDVWGELAGSGIPTGRAPSILLDSLSGVETSGVDPYINHLMQDLVMYRAKDGQPARFCLGQEDEVTRALRELTEVRKIHVWQVFSINVLRGARERLEKKGGAGPERPWLELRDYGRAVKTSLRTVPKELDRYGNLVINAWPASARPVIASLDTKINTVVEERIADSEPQRSNLDEQGRDLALFRANPVLCGTWLWSFRIEQHALGIEFINGSGAVMSMTHFYEALRAQGAVAPITTGWPDLDYLMKLHGIETFFPGGEVPASAERAAQLYLLCMGEVSATIKAKDRRPGARPRRGKPRLLDQLGPVSMEFVPRYESILKSRWVKSVAPARREMRQEDVERSLEKSRWEVTETDSGSLVVTRLPSSGQQQQQPQQPGPTRQTLGTTAAAAADPRPVADVTRDLLFALHAEAPELTFNYIEFHRRVRAAFQHAGLACRDAVVKDGGVPYLTTNYAVLLPTILLPRCFRHDLAGSGEPGYADQMRAAGEALGRCLDRAEGGGSFILDGWVGKYAWR